MNTLMSAAGFAGFQADLGQNDSEHIIDISKLVNIAESIQFNFPDEIKAIHVKPACVLQEKLESLSAITICVTVSYNTGKPELCAEIEDLVNAFVQDEYKSIKDKVKVSFMESDGLSSLCLWSESFIVPRMISDGYELNILNTLIQSGYKVAISNNWANEYHTTLIVFVEDVAKITSAMSDIDSLAKKNGMELSLAESSNTKSFTYNYIVYAGNSIPYGLPYVFVDESDINKQILETFLNS